MLTFGSVCSGIEAASVAWHPLGWRAAWFAEVDRAASEVLAYRFPDVPNHGDMTLLAGMIRRREIPAPDALVGGTPCQAFSVAGMRRGLDDERGQLTLAYVDLANAIDEVRAADGLDPVIIVWENVPGVLTSKDNAFGCFLAGIAGEDDPLVPAGKKWTNAGAVCGPERAIAWRTLDAQWFGLAQRRRRVFVVASAREGFDPAAILLEFDGVRRDSAPSREAGEGSAGTLASRTTGGGFPGTDEACSGYLQPVDWGAGDAELALPELRGGVAGQICDDPAGHGLAVAPGMRQMRQRGGEHLDRCDGRLRESAELVPTWRDGRDVSQTLDAVLHKGQTMPEKNRFPAVLQPIAFTAKDYGGDATDNLSPTLRSMGHNGSHANGGGQIGVCYGLTTEQTPKFNEDCALTLTKQSPTGGGQPQAVAYSVALRGREGGATAELGDDVAGCLRASGGGGDKPHVLAMRESGPGWWTEDEVAGSLRVGADTHANAGVPPAIAYRTTGNSGCYETGDKVDALTTGTDPNSHIICVTGDVTHTLKAEGFDASEDGTGRGHPITLAMRESGPGWWTEDEVAGSLRVGGDIESAAAILSSAVCITGDVTHTLKAEGFDASEDGTGRGQPIVPCGFQASQSGVRINATAGTLDANYGSRRHNGVLTEMAVRRLLPVECERLQGFPDNWTLVPTGKNGKPAADGPRYKQLGNSMAVNVMHWIGRRIADHLRRDDDDFYSLIGHNRGPALDEFEALL